MLYPHPSFVLGPSLPLRQSPRKHTSLHACAAAASETSPPRTLDETIAQASISLDKAVSDPTKRRAKLSAIIPGLNPLIEEAVPYSDATLNKLAYSLAETCPTLAQQPTLSLLFKSAGTAAAARNTLITADPTETVQSSRITFASYFRRDTSTATESRVSQHANIVINPTSARGDRIMDDLESVISEAPEALWILLNADLGLDRAAVGMREMGRRDSFLDTFAEAFYFRNLFEIRRPQLIPVERGALLYEYPGPWRLFALVRGAYVSAGEFEKQPSAEDITACVRQVTAQVIAASGERKNAVGDRKSEMQFLLVLALCAATFAAAYAGLVALPH